MYCFLTVPDYCMYWSGVNDPVSIEKYAVVFVYCGERLGYYNFLVIY
jgi:hypothetical protein